MGLHNCRAAVLTNLGGIMSAPAAPSQPPLTPPGVWEAIDNRPVAGAVVLESQMASCLSGPISDRFG